MMPKNAMGDRADQIFRVGPETLVASSHTIVAGQVSHYLKEITKATQPGPDGFPLEWKITAEIAQPVILKGGPIEGPIHFTRYERAFMAPGPPPSPLWEHDFGHIASDGEVVLFFKDDASKELEKAIPSSAGEQDFLKLVKDILSADRVTDPKQRNQRWLSYLSSGPSSEGYRVALRSLVHSHAEWRDLEEPLRKILIRSDLSPDTRAYTFAFVAFQITQNAWGANSDGPLNLLCNSFSSQTDPKLAFRDLSSFSLLLRYASEQPVQKSRQPVRDRSVSCLKSWASLGFADSNLSDEFKRMQKQYSF